MDVDAKEGLLRKNDQINGMIFNYHGNQEDKWRQEFNKSFLFDRGIQELETSIRGILKKLVLFNCC